MRRVTLASAGQQLDTIIDYSNIRLFDVGLIGDDLQRTGWKKKKATRPSVSTGCLYLYYFARSFSWG